MTSYRSGITPSEDAEGVTPCCNIFFKDNTDASICQAYSSL